MLAADEAQPPLNFTVDYNDIGNGDDDDPKGPLAALVGRETMAIIGGVVGFWGGTVVVGIFFFAAAAWR
jgi:hypothetical protein